MYKPDNLRAFLTAAFADLAINPDRMLVFIDKGTLVSTAAPALSFEYRYTLQLILTDFAGDPDLVLVPLLVWVRKEQNELLANPDNRDRITFEVDVIDNGKVDIDIKLPLTERVGVRARADGGYDIEHYHEPELEADLSAEHWKLYVKGELVLEWDVPPA